MNQNAPIVGSSQSVDIPALQDLATNGKLMAEALSEIIQALDSWREIVLKATHGGTGLDTYVIGDLLYANTASTLARLADVAVGKVLVSGGVGAAPAWGDVPAGSLSGIVPVVNGGTGLDTLTLSNLLVGAGTSDVTFIAPGSNGNFLASNGSVFSSSSGATAAQYRANTSTATALRPAEIWASTAVEALTDAATISLDLSAGFNFSVTIGGNRTIGNPTNVKVGQSGCIAVTASGATRTIDVGSNWYATTSIPLPISISSGQVCYLFYFCFSSTIILLTGALNNPT